jgi:hypothetical protein
MAAGLKTTDESARSLRSVAEPKSAGGKDPESQLHLRGCDDRRPGLRPRWSHVMFINDNYRRAATHDGRLQEAGDRELLPTRIEDGAKLGSGVVILGGYGRVHW